MQKIGYPVKSPDLRNASMLEEYYETVDISRSGFFDNLISIAKFSAHREWFALGKPTDRDEWGMTVPTVNVSRMKNFVELSSSYINSPTHPTLHNIFFVNRTHLTSFRLTTTRLGTRSFFLRASCKRLSFTILLYPYTSATVHLDPSVATSCLTVSVPPLVLEAYPLNMSSL